MTSFLDHTTCPSLNLRYWEGGISPDMLSEGMRKLVVSVSKVIAPVLDNHSEYLIYQFMAVLVFYCSEETPWQRQLLQKKAFNWGLAYSFRGLVHCYHGRKHGSTRGEMMRKKLGATFSSAGWETRFSMGFWNFKTHPHWHTSSNKAASLNSLKQRYSLVTNHSKLSLWRPFLFKQPQ